MDMETVSAHVNNVAPNVGTISAPSDPIPVGAAVVTSAPFSDQGTLDTHTAVWDWGDGTTSAGTVNEAGGAGLAAGSHAYSDAGVYTVTLTVTDKDGASTQSIFQYVVVYDTEAGYVTGGGWIDSPAGAYALDPTASGRAQFGFISRYKKGANVPTGNTEFQFRAGNLNFSASNYDWLVVGGHKAKYKGTGTINGEGSYGFMLSVVDGQSTGGPDRFRIKIWDKVTGSVIYDNQGGEPEDADATTTVAGGNIVIHRQ
jgi:PKD repeat protein